MRFFKTDPKVPVVPATPSTPVQKPPAIDGWPESELGSVYNAAPVKHLRKGEAVFTDLARSDSFFVLVGGVVQVMVKVNGQPGQPATFKRGDCIAPLSEFSGFSYSAETAEDSAIVEIAPTVLRRLPDKAQLCIHRVAMSSSDRINAYIRSVNSEMTLRNLRLSQYILNQNAARSSAIESTFVKNFLQGMRPMPVYATSLSVKLLDENISVQEIVEGIKIDPVLAGIVLRTVNSAQYGFGKKVESFYHACMILGFNNIYNLLMREAAQVTMPITRETTRIHRHSCLISLLSSEVASLVKEQHSETIATIGLLHDFGKSVQVMMKTAHPDKTDFVESLDTAKLGAGLLRNWGIPERICRTIEFQQQPEFMSPDLIAPEYRREAAALHVAHVLEMLLLDRPVDPVKSIYTPEHMAVLRLDHMSPAELLRDRVLPNLSRNKTRVPPDVHSIVFRSVEKS